MAILPREPASPLKQMTDNTPYKAELEDNNSNREWEWETREMFNFVALNLYFFLGNVIIFPQVLASFHEDED